MLFPTENRTQTDRVYKRNLAIGNVLQTSVNMLQHKRLSNSISRLMLKKLLVWGLSGSAFGLGLFGSWRLEESWKIEAGQLSLLGDRAIAQQVDPQLKADFLSDPLTSKPRDPLLPPVDEPRPLRPLELRALREDLAALNQLARDQLAQGQTDEAFALLLREIRLRRIFGPVEEFNAIAAVAELAWEQQRSEEVQLLTLRMREIWQAAQADIAQAETSKPEAVEEGGPVVESADATEDDAAEGNTAQDQLLAPLSSLATASKQSDIEVLTAIARVFITLRDVDSSVAVYQQIIDLAIAQGADPTPIQRELAAYHLTWFQFAQAADVYLVLLDRAKVQGNQTLEIEYLEQLVYSYQQANSLENAARARTDLLALYQASGQEEKLPDLLLAIAQNYRALNWTNDAIRYYRSAYSVAQRFEQFSISAQVLRDLGEVYRAIALTDEALIAYNLLVPVEEQAYNDYGIMNAYDNIGQLERRKGNLAEALQAFQKALVIANRLSLDEDYFVDQIESVTQLEQPQ